MSFLFNWFGKKKEKQQKIGTEFLFRANWPYVNKIELHNEGQFFFLNEELVVSISARAILIYNAKYGDLINTFAEGKYIQFADLSPNKKLLAVSRGKELELYNLDIKNNNAACEKIISFSPQFSHAEILYAKFLTDDLLMWLSRRDDKYHIFNINNWISSNKPLLYTIPQLASSLRSLAISPDGNTLAIGEQSTSITSSFRVIDTTCGEVLWKFEAKEELPQASVTNFGFSPDSTMLASGYYSGSIYVFDTRTGEPISFMPAPDIHIIEDYMDKMNVGHRIGHVAGLIFDFKDSENKALISASGTDVLRFDINSWKFKKFLYPPDILPQARIEGDLVKLKISTDGDVLAAGFTDGNILCFDALSGQQTYFLKSIFKKSVSHIAFSPEGKYLGASYEGTGYFGDDGRSFGGKTIIWNLK